MREFWKDAKPVVLTTLLVLLIALAAEIAVGRIG